MTAGDAELLARAVSLTRVSYFTRADRELLVELVREVTGWDASKALLGRWRASVSPPERIKP